jgi:small subunit ribosomal protein S1
MMDKHEDISMEEVLKSLEEIQGEIGEVVVGTVTGKAEDGLIVDFGGKFEGFVPSRELVKSIDEYESGQKLDLLLYRIDEDEGRAYLSERRPKFRKALEKIQQMLENGEKVIKGRIIGEVKGGYKVMVEGVLDAFLPGSHSLIKRGEEIPSEELEFEIISFEKRGRRHNLVLSRRSLLEKKISEFFENIKEGDEVEGTVESVQDFGVFVRLTEGVTGLLPRSEISYTRIASIKDMFKEGDILKLKVISVDRSNRKVTLSLKAMMPDPFEEFKKDYGIGDKVSGEVLRIRQDGFTMRLPHDLVGFVPMEEIFWGRKGRIRDIVREGEVVEAEVVEINDENRRIVLSYKKAKGDPWERVEEKYPVESEHDGRVVRVLQTGVIVELEDGISGFVPLSELSWHYFDVPSEVVRERRKVKVKVLSIDKENRKMRLSIKQTQKNPWERVIQELNRGSVVRGRVRKELNSGYVVRIKDYNVDAFLPSNHVEEELKVGSDLEAVVLRILDDRKFGKKMIISVKDLEEMKAVKKYQEEAQEVQKNLGDLLKKRLSEGE